MDRRLIDHFVNAKVLSRQDMQRVILRSAKDKTGVVTQLLDAGLVEDELLAEHIAEFYGVATLDSGDFFVDPNALTLLTERIAQKAGALAYGFEPGTERVMLAVFDPGRAQDVIEMLESATGQPPLVRVCPKMWLEKAIDYHYELASASTESADQNADLSKAGVVSRRNTSSPGGRRPSSDFGKDGAGKPLSGVHRMRRGRTNSSPDPRGSSSHGPRGGGNTSTGPTTSSRSLDEALDDFDDFLNDADDQPVMSPRSSFNGRPRSGHSLTNPNESSIGGGSGSPAFWEEPENPQGNVSGASWAWDDFDTGIRKEPLDSKAGEEIGDGFSLFEESEPKVPQEMTLQEIVEMHHQKIKSLKEEAKSQREVIQALADLLIEARVVSRRELKRRLRKMRAEKHEDS